MIMRVRLSARIGVSVRGRLRFDIWMRGMISLGNDADNSDEFTGLKQLGLARDQLW